MSDHTRIQELLEEALESGRTPEDVCAACSELLPQLIEHLHRYRSIEAQIDMLFPSSNEGMAVRRRRLISGDEPLPQIAGYHVDAVLGRGGVGVVYQANQLKLNRYVALKMLLSGVYADPHELVRFRREAEAVASLRHAHIVQIYDVGEHNGNPYFTMEILDGGNLAQKLDGTPQPAMAAAALIATLASATHVAHLGGIVHRDLKPSNILLADDGTPKITDFGLARRIEEDAAITQTGARVGTPSYMAPEQATGKSDVGPAADIYALGAILYEMLTGRPPFRAETAAETQRQLIAEEPVPPSRLNRMVPRDLETICLKCLRKEPQSRYAAAAALGEDIGRFQRGEPIAARSTGLPERVAKWTRRHPGPAVAIVGGMGLVIALISGAFWILSQRAATAELVENDLRDVARFQQRLAWSDARASLERATARLGASGSAALAARVAQHDRELQLVARLDAIRLARASHTNLVIDLTESYRDYAAAFRDAGLGALGDDPIVVAQRIAALDIRPVLIDALDDWVVCTIVPSDQKWLTDVARHADGNPTDWRARARDPSVWNDRAAMMELVKMLSEDPVLTQLDTGAAGGSPSVSLLVALGARLRASLGNAAAIPFMERVQQAHPADFWANFSLGEALAFEGRAAEAVGYYRAAVSLRPDAEVGHIHLGQALADSSRPDEAIKLFRQAAQLNPNWFRPHLNIGTTLSRLGRFDEAQTAFREALRLAPDAEVLKKLPGVAPHVAVIHAGLALTLQRLGKNEEAIEHHQRTLSLDPSRKLAAAKGQREVRIAQRRWEEALAIWRSSIIDEPTSSHQDWHGYAELCLFLHREEDFRRARQGLFARFGTTADPNIAERTCRSCLLMPGTPDETMNAAALIDRALATEPAATQYRHYFMFAKGLAEYRLGRMESAVTILRGDVSRVLGPAPYLVLAMSYERLGRRADALASLASAAVAIDWSSERAGDTDYWMYHILRREAEQLLLPNLPAFLEGRYVPRESKERLAMTPALHFARRYVALAQLWSDVLANDAGLIDSARAYAVVAAGLAGTVVGSDTESQTDADRARWRKQARDWMGEELDTAGTRLQEESGRQRLRFTLNLWSTSPGLAGVRDETALEKLSEAERAQWKALWAQVAIVLNRVQTRK